MANPKGTVCHFRQILGQNYEQVDVNLLNAHCQVPLISRNKTPVFNIEYYKDGDEEATVEQYTATEITAKYLRKLKETAEYFTGSNVDGCVVSIPAHFEESQKKELLKAARDAGFESAYALHEPVAAAMAFDTSCTKESLDQQILVLDLGADSFNISVISKHDGLYTIEESVEEANLGGSAFDKVLLEIAKDEFKRKTKLDISDNKRSIAKLLKACEMTKRALTRQDPATCYVESLYDGMDYNGTILRSRFDMQAEPLYARCKDSIGNTLKKCNLDASHIDQVILVGGSTRMPKFQSFVKSLFPDVQVRCDVEADEAISYGCALQATILADNDINFNTKFDESLINAEHVSKTIGIETSKGGFYPVIPSGTPLPVRREFTVPLAPNQNSCFLNICEDKISSSVAQVVLSGIPPVENGSVKVVFLIEQDHNLHVTMAEKVSGAKLHVKI